MWLWAQKVAGARAAGLDLSAVRNSADILASGGSPARAANQRLAWEARTKANGQREQFEAALSGDIPASLPRAISALKAKFSAEKPAVATRKASEMTLEIINAELPNTVGGSADLTGSVFTKTKNDPVIAPGYYAGRFVHYGVREHGMAAAMNGVALHKGLIPFAGTFLVFSDYCRPSIRLAALMGQRVIQRDDA
jgi:transketolase